MSKAREVDDLAADVHRGRGSRPGASTLFLTTMWFGLVAGWLELALVVGQRAIHPHVSLDAIRTNQHFVWMIPVSDVLIFSVVGVAIALLATFRQKIARWAALRLPVALSSLALLLNIEGLSAIAGVILAAGLASIVARCLKSRAVWFGRLVRMSLPVMAVSLVVLTWLTLPERVASAESRAYCATSAREARCSQRAVNSCYRHGPRSTCLSLYGHERPTAPNLERLARKGFVFSEARSTAPWTVPTPRQHHDRPLAPRALRRARRAARRDLPDPGRSPGTGRSIPRLDSSATSIIAMPSTGWAGDSPGTRTPTRTGPYRSSKSCGVPFLGRRGG